MNGTLKSIGILVPCHSISLNCNRSLPEILSIFKANVITYTYINMGCNIIGLTNNRDQHVFHLILLKITLICVYVSLTDNLQFDTILSAR